MDWRKFTGLLLIVYACAGCHHGPPPEFPNWVADLPQPDAGNSGDNAFSAYAKAASDAEAASGRYLNMVSFFPGQKDEAMKATAPSLSLVESASSSPCTFEFKPTSPFVAPPYQKGWRIIGRDLVWKIDDAIQANDYDKAVSAAVTATKFGFDISGGGATDASLGLAIADEARKAIAPVLDHMGASQLETLAAGISKALAGKPPLSQVIDHEHENMLQAVQTVQDDYHDEHLDDLAKILSADGRDTIDYLEEMHGKDATLRPKFFNGLAGEADSDCTWAKAIADLPVIQQDSKPPLRLDPKRPWRTLAKELFGSLQPLMEINDATLARTRLLIIESTALQMVKATGSAPANLAQFPPDIQTDPYSGKPFIYGADGADYHVYSVGRDFRDDGGETDETYTTPDLRLEKSD